MNNPELTPDNDPNVFTDKVEQLFQELELAVMWQRPSFLFSIYRSEAVRKDAEALLAKKLGVLKQRLSTILLDDVADLEMLPRFFLSPQAKQTIFFVRGMVWDCSQESVSAYKEINRYQELFPDNSIRVVFWIMEKEISNLIACAPEYWNFRHRAVDFTGISQTDSQDSSPSSNGTSEGTETIREFMEPDQFSLPVEIEPEEMPMPEDAIAQNVNHLLSLGIAHWRKNDFQKSSDYILAALETTRFVDDPWLKARCHHALALVKTSLGKYEQAIDAYQQAISLAPNRIFPWNNLGQLYQKLDMLQEAISAYEKAIELKPDDPFSWNGLGNVYAEMGLTQNAIAAYQKAIKLSPDFANAFTGQGNVYASQGAFNEAIASYQQATKINPRLITPWINLGNALQKKEQYERAIHAYRNAITLDQTIVNVWNELGNSFVKMAAYDEAIESYEQVIHLNPGFGWPYANLAYAHFKKGEYSEAINLYEKSIELLDDDSGKAFSWNRLGDAYRQLQDYKKALHAYQTADQLSNGKVKTNHVLADSGKSGKAVQGKTLQFFLNISRDGQLQSAIESEECPESEPLSTGTEQSKGERECRTANDWNCLGNTHLRAGCYSEAIKAYKKAMDLSPDSVWAYLNNLTLAYYKKGKQQGGSMTASSASPDPWTVDDTEMLDYLKQTQPVELPEEPANSVTLPSMPSLNESELVAVG